MSNPNWTAPPAVPDAVDKSSNSQGSQVDKVAELQDRLYRLPPPDTDRSLPQEVAAALSQQNEELARLTQTLDDAELCAALRDRCAPEYIDGKPTATAWEHTLMEAAARIKHLSAECRFLHNRRGQLVIERDRYAAALGEYPDGRDIILASTLAALKAAESLVDQQKERIAELEKVFSEYIAAADQCVSTKNDDDVAAMLRFGEADRAARAALAADREGETK